MKLYRYLMALVLAGTLILSVACDSSHSSQEDAAYDAVRNACKKDGSTDKQCDCLVDYVKKQAKAGNRATMDVDTILQTNCK